MMDFQKNIQDFGQLLPNTDEIIQLNLLFKYQGLLTFPMHIEDPFHKKNYCLQLNSRIPKHSKDLQSKCIEIYILVHLDSHGLFDYKANEKSEIKDFKAIVHYLDIPGNSQEVFYFFHQEIKKPSNIRIERRVKNVSTFDVAKIQVKQYKLMGGVMLLRKGQKVMMQTIAAQNIEVEPIGGDFERIETELPYLVVKCFQEEGYPLRSWQKLKVGRMLFKLDEVVASPEDLELDGQNQVDLDLLHKEEESVEEPTCKICYQPDKNEDILVNPCGCSGSNGNIHISCLKTWIKMRLTKLKSEDKGHLFYMENLFCQICKKAFPRTVTKHNKKYLLLDFINTAQPFLSVKVINTSPHAQVGNEKKLYIVMGDENKKATIGRFASNGVLFEEVTVSRFHAEIFVREGQEGGRELRVRDLNSKFGTLIYEEGMEVKLGKRERAIQISKTVLAFRIVDKKQISQQSYFNRY